MEIISPALEPQVSVKSTKRAAIVGVALELFCKRIAAMPMKAKLDLCHYARRLVYFQMCPHVSTYITNHGSFKMMGLSFSTVLVFVYF